MSTICDKIDSTEIIKLRYKDISDLLDNETYITLKDTHTSYLIQIYIMSCYTGYNDFNEIRPDDFIEFLKFIDWYPTNILSIEYLEQK